MVVLPLWLPLWLPLLLQSSKRVVAKCAGAVGSPALHGAGTLNRLFAAILSGFRNASAVGASIQVMKWHSAEQLPLLLEVCSSSLN